MKTITICFFLFISVSLNSQSWQWALGGTDNFGARSVAVATDAKGFVYLAADGGFTSNCGGGIGFSKFDSNGQFLWHRTLAVGIEALCVDKKGNCFLTGSFGGSAFLCGGANSSLTITSTGHQDVFLAKYDQNGNLNWVKTFGDTMSDDVARSVKTDVAGNVLLTGSYFYYENTIIHNNDFISKYDSLGNLLWNKTSNWKGFATPVSIDVDASGASYVTGTFSDSAFFGNTILTQPFTTDNIYMVKYNPSGIVVWAKKIGNNPSTRNVSYGLALDNKGSFFITGWYEGPTAFDSFTISSTSNSRGMFLAKYDINGNALWVRNTNVGFGYGLAVDSSGNCMVTGGFPNTINFSSPTNSTSLLSSRTNHDIFLANYGSSGNILWAIKPGGSGGHGAHGKSIAIDKKNNCYITGLTTESTIFGNHTLYQPVSLKGSNDLFLAKYGEKDSTLNSDVSLKSYLNHGAQIFAYPNPADKNVTIEITNPLQSAVGLTVISPAGQVLKSTHLRKGLSTYSETMNLESIPTGIYFVKILMNGEHLIKKIAVVQD